MGRRDSGPGPTPTSGGGTRWHALFTAERVVGACRQSAASRWRRHTAERAATGLTLPPRPPPQLLVPRRGCEIITCYEIGGCGVVVLKMSLALFVGELLAVGREDCERRVAD